MIIIQRRLFLQVSSIIYGNNSYRHIHRRCSKYFKHRAVFQNRVFSTTTCDIPLEGPDDFCDMEPSVDIHAIVGSDPEKVREMKNLVLEVDFMRQSGEVNFPTAITPEQWRELLNTAGRQKRLAYLQFLFLKEKRKLSRKSVLAKKAELFQIAKESREVDNVKPTTCSPPKYCLNHVSLFYRILPQSMNKVYHYRLAQAMMFGSPILLDCGYEQYMNDIEIRHCANQVLHMWSHNRVAGNPFHIIYCNVDRQSKMMSHLNKIMPHLYDEDTFFHFTEKNYLDLFPAEQLVYLTPHCNEELETFDKSSVYIVGAYVDEKSNIPVSLAKAKRDGLRMAKFPLDRYLNWCQGSKYLPLNQVVDIMGELKDGACWQYALRHVASRKQTFTFMDNDVLNKKKSDRKRMLAYAIRNQYRRDLSENIISTNEIKEKSRNYGHVDEK